MAQDWAEMKEGKLELRWEYLRDVMLEYNLDKVLDFHSVYLMEKM